MEPIVTALRNRFNTGVTKSIRWRKQQLLALDRLLDENQQELCAAIKQDFNKPEQETITLEIAIIKNHITYCLNNIDEYARPHQVTPHIQLRATYSTYVQYQPYGVVLVIGAWNYPFQLCLVPLVSAIACGNCVLLKPSELASNSAEIMQRLVEKYMDNVGVLNGLNLKFYFILLYRTRLK